MNTFEATRPCGTEACEGYEQYAAEGGNTVRNEVFFQLLGRRAAEWPYTAKFDRKLLIALIFRFLRFSYAHPRQEPGRAQFRIGA